MGKVVTTRLTNTGNLVLGYGYFDETSQSTISTKGNVIYTALLDEVTNAGGSQQMRHFQSGNLQVSGVFDEVTGMLVTDGLIAYIDASKSFNGNGVTTGSSVPIFDLVANNNATLSGTVNWVNRGDGSYWNWPTASASNYISSTLAQNYLDFTIVFQPDFTLTSDASLVGLIGTSTDATNSDKSLRFLGANGTGPWTLRNPDNTDGWASTATTFYLNGVASTTDGAALASGWNILGGKRTNTTNGTFAAPFKYFLGTEGYSTVRDFRGNIAAVAFYNRQLTAAEQLNNYNYFAARYGLPTLGI
jgi:hypothetical protein